MIRNGNVAIISAPRSGSSFLAGIVSKVKSSLDDQDLFPGLSISRSNSQFNPHGYRESVGLNLLLDQLIRMRLGERASFLYNRKSKGIEPSEFDYDLDTRVEIPEDFLTNVRFYTGHDWDVWGLSRMGHGEKWWAAYSRAGVRSGLDVERTWSRFLSLFGEPRGMVVKDPRLLYLASELPTSTRIVIIRRRPEHLQKSMREHYGRRLFTDSPYPGFDWVSNHFNYRVPPQEFDEYLGNVDTIMTGLQATHETQTILNETLSEKSAQRRVFQFVGIT